MQKLRRYIDCIRPDMTDDALGVPLSDRFGQCNVTMAQWGGANTLARADRLGLSGAHHLEIIDSKGCPPIYLSAHLAKYELAD